MDHLADLARKSLPRAVQGRLGRWRLAGSYQRGERRGRPRVFHRLQPTHRPQVLSHCASENHRIKSTLHPMNTLRYARTQIPASNGSQRQWPGSCHTALTLLELLVVLAMLVVWISVLIP